MILYLLLVLIALEISMLRRSLSSKQVSALVLPLAYLVSLTRILSYVLLLTALNLYVVDSIYYGMLISNLGGGS